MNRKAIACIGWGSLVWNPGPLPRVGVWHEDGPMLPVEFARESADKRITLVICPGLPVVRTCWTFLDVPDVRTAITQLGAREYPNATAKWIERNIGFWDHATGAVHGFEASTIAVWAESLALDGVVWTNLPCKFRNENGVMPTCDEVIAYLLALDKGPQADAEEYVRKAPAQIDTPYRRRLALELGWTHLDLGGNSTRTSVSTAPS